MKRTRTLSTSALILALGIAAAACGNETEGPRRRSRGAGVVVSGNRLKTITADAPTTDQKRNQILITDLELAERWFQIGAEMSGALTLKGVTVKHNCAEATQSAPLVTLELLREREGGSLERSPIYSSTEEATQISVSVDSKVKSWIGARVQNYGHCGRVDVSFDFSMASVQIK